MFALIQNEIFIKEVLPGIDFDPVNQPNNVVQVKLIEPSVGVFQRATRNNPEFNQTSNEWEATYAVSDLTGDELIEAQKVYSKLVSDTVQKILDAEAQDREYDDINSLCSYRNSRNPIFAAEAEVAFQWRDDVWDFCSNVRQAVLSGERTPPTIGELVQEMPKPVWPSRG